MGYQQLELHTVAAVHGTPYQTAVPSLFKEVGPEVNGGAMDAFAVGSLHP